MGVVDEKDRIDVVPGTVRPLPRDSRVYLWRVRQLWAGFGLAPRPRRVRRPRRRRGGDERARARDAGDGDGDGGDGDEGEDEDEVEDEDGEVDGLELAEDEQEEALEAWPPVVEPGGAVRAPGSGGAPPLTIIRGFSTDAAAIRSTSGAGPYDLVYIDGR
jgi:hypothetical protein